MLKIEITEGRHTRFEQAINILGVAGGTRGLGLALLATFEGETELGKDLYEELEADIANVGDSDAKEWLRNYGIGEEAKKLRAGKHPLQDVFDAVIEQVTSGKGQRHGGGEQPFFEQPWFTTTQQVGIGFPLGQAMKKLGETSSKPDNESFETELLGAIAYAAMAYLANKKLASKP